MPDHFARKQGNERRIGRQIAATEPQWLLPRAVEPFEAVLLVPQRGPFCDSCEHIERPPNAMDDARTSGLAPPAQEELLLGGGHAEKQQGGFGTADIGRDLGFFVGREIAVTGPGDAEFGETSTHLFEHLLEDVRSRPQEVDPPASLFGFGKQLQEEINACYPFRQRDTEHATCPHNGLPVRQDHLAAAHGLLEPNIPAHRHDLGGIHYPDGQVLAMLHRFSASSDRLSRGERVDPDAEHV